MHNRFGFTLIELLIVISIIGVIALIGVAAYMSVSKSGRDSKRQSDLKVIQSEMERYYADQGFYPAESAMQTILGNGNAFTSSIGNPSPPSSVKTYLNKTPENISSDDYSYKAIPTGCANTVGSKCTSYCLYSTVENTNSVPSNTNRYNNPPGSCALSGYNFAVSPP